MKHKCHYTDIFPLDQLINLMKEDGVTPKKVVSDDFMNWDQVLNDFYRPLAPNTAIRVLRTRRVNYSVIEKQFLFKGKKKQQNWKQFDAEQT